MLQEKFIYLSEKKKVDKSCGTPFKNFVDISVNTVISETGKKIWKVDGIAGRTFEDFDILLKRMYNIKCRKIDLKIRLLVWINLGISFECSRDFVFWPNKLTMPDCLKLDFENVTVIIECRKLHIEIPPKLEIGVNRIIKKDSLEKF